MLLGCLGCAELPVAASEPTITVSAAVFQQQVTIAEGRVVVCHATAAGCVMANLPTVEERVTRENGAGSFEADWQWLRDAVQTAQTAAPDRRTASMEAAYAHLAEWAAEVGAGSGGLERSAFASERTTANGVLARGEFRAAEGPSWLDRQVARVEDWFLGLFLGMEGIGARNPWLAPLVEWSCFLLAAAGLLFFVRRSLQRQALRISLGDGVAVMRGSDQDSADWVRLAEERAAAADWREAIHCVYWAAIASLEARRAWRGNPTRTPREYPRLLRRGSEAERALRALTGIFEQVWYGHGAAEESEFRAAQKSFQAIEAADLKRDTASATAAASVAGAA